MRTLLPTAGARALPSSCCCSSSSSSCSSSSFSSFSCCCCCSSSCCCCCCCCCYPHGMPRPHRAVRCMRLLVSLQVSLHRNGQRVTLLEEDSLAGPGGSSPGEGMSTVPRQPRLSPRFPPPPLPPLLLLNREDDTARGQRICGCDRSSHPRPSRQEHKRCWRPWRASRNLRKASAPWQPRSAATSGARHSLLLLLLFLLRPLLLLLLLLLWHQGRQGAATGPLVDPGQSAGAPG